jgi:Peptidase family S41/N-terminal domain of Peptidase_S41 in eukaryotic IRBP
MLPSACPRAVCSLVALLIGAIGVHAEGTEAGIDDAARRAVVQNAAEALEQRYVLPEVGKQAAEAIKAALAAGNYDGDESGRFAQQLTGDMQSVTHDKHTYVIMLGSTPATGAHSVKSALPRQEGGIVRADRLPDNIGYIEIVAFPDLVRFKVPLDRAMAALASTRALIIDTRRNHGGDPKSEVYLTSYFLDGTKPVAVSKFIFRNPGTESFQTRLLLSTPTPVSYRGKPVYVLTSRSSVSAGEALAYDMHSLGVAVVVGEATGGGANAGVLVPLGHNMSMFVATARGENPTTGTNWEGGGVAADVPTPADDALKVALKELGVSSDHTQIADLSKALLFEPGSVPKTDSESGHGPRQR